jgi:hypothetical protein
VELLVWNSQGASGDQGRVRKWEVIWENGIAPRVPAVNPALPPAPAGPRLPADNFAFLMCESGWAPWISQEAQVQVNGIYPLVADRTFADPALVAASGFCTGALAVGATSFWIPWVNKIDSLKTNVRCSLGGFYVPSSKVDATRWLHAGTRSMIYRKKMRRPMVRMSLGHYGQGLLVHMVHLTARRGPAEAELQWLMNEVPKLTAGPVLIVGDININLLKSYPAFLPPPLIAAGGWTVLSSGEKTQKKGGELDWGLLYDPHQSFAPGGLSAKVFEYPAAGSWNTSDHAVMRYVLTPRA